MPYMYILQCADGSYYTGSTWNLEKRLWEHQQGLGANHTAKRLPVQLVYCEQCDSIQDAYRREKQVQGWSRKKKEALIAGDIDQLKKLASSLRQAQCKCWYKSNKLSARASTKAISSVQGLAQKQQAQCKGWYKNDRLSARASTKAISSVQGLVQKQQALCKCWHKSNKLSARAGKKAISSVQGLVKKQQAQCKGW